MEGNNDIFLSDDHALEYFPGPMHKTYFMTFIWVYPFSTCGFYDRFFDPSHIPPCVNTYAFRVLLPFAYVISSI